MNQSPLLPQLPQLLTEKDKLKTARRHALYTVTEFEERLQFAIIRESLKPATRLELFTAIENARVELQDKDM